MAELPIGERALMLLVSDRDPELLRYLTEIGLHPGIDVTVLARAPFDGPITLRVGGTEVVVGSRVAEQVLVAADHSSLLTR